MIALVPAYPPAGPAAWGPGEVPVYEGGGSAEPIHAASFDGTNDRLSQPEPMSGPVDGKRATFVFDFKLNGGDGASQYIIAGPRSGGIGYWIERMTNNKLRMLARNLVNQNRVLVDSTATYVAGPSWHRAALSFDTGAGVSHMVVDRVDVKNQITMIDDAIDFTVGADVGGNSQSGSKWFNGCLGNVYVNLGEYIDWGLEANLNKIWDGTTAIPITGDGSGLTGTAPSFLLANPFDSFHLDRSGRDNHFTVIGSLAACADGPLG